MPRYRNRNTGDEVDYDTPNPRLEHLPNWRRLDEPKHAAAEAPLAKPAASRPPARPRKP